MDGRKEEEEEEEERNRDRVLLSSSLQFIHSMNFCRSAMDCKYTHCVLQGVYLDVTALEACVRNEEMWKSVGNSLWVCFTVYGRTSNTDTQKDIPGF
jgi:hypothetical protein